MLLIFVLNFEIREFNCDYCGIDWVIDVIFFVIEDDDDFVNLFVEICVEFFVELGDLVILIDKVIE